MRNPLLKRERNSLATESGMSFSLDFKKAKQLNRLKLSALCILTKYRELFCLILNLFIYFPYF